LQVVASSLEGMVAPDPTQQAAVKVIDLVRRHSMNRA
jgi:hypothetical protein